MLQAKYESSSPYGLGQEDFKDFLPISMWNPVTPQHRANFHIGTIIWSILVEGHYMMSDTKYESSSPYCSWQKDFYLFFLMVAMATRVLHGIEIFEIFWKCITQGSFLRSFIEICWQVLEKIFKVIIHGGAEGWTDTPTNADNDRSQ